MLLEQCIRVHFNRKQKEENVTMKKEAISIISWYGTSDVGGVERVVRLLMDIFSEYYEVELIDGNKCVKEFPIAKKLCNTNIGRMLVASFVAKSRKSADRIIIGNGFNAPFIKKDINFAHGTMYSLKKRLGQFVWGGSSVFEMISMKKTDRIIAVSSEAKASLVKDYHIDERKITVVNNCVDDKLFYPKSKELNSAQNVILFVGRLETGKGLKDLIELAKFLEQQEKFYLKIATPSNENIELFSGLRNTVVFPNLRYEEMNNFYNSGDVMYFPSKSEGFELVTLECLCAGIPVICFGVGAAGEILAKKGPGVYLAEGKDEILLEQLMRIIEIYKNSEKRRELHCWISENFGYDLYKKKILELVQK